jgi:hypothetical protein
VAEDHNKYRPPELSSFWGPPQVLTERKKKELQDRKEKDALQQGVLDEESLKYLQETLSQ